MPGKRRSDCKWCSKENHEKGSWVRREKEEKDDGLMRMERNVKQRETRVWGGAGEMGEKGDGMNKPKSAKPVCSKTDAAAPKKRGQ